MDTLSKDRRCEIMRRIRAKDTAPEISVRDILRELGVPFGCHPSNRPGTPDILLSECRTVIFVHGCFWHGHTCLRGKRPATRKRFWNGKIDGNIRRDRRVKRALWARGWHVLTIWECHLKRPDTVRRKVGRLNA